MDIQLDSIILSALEQPKDAISFTMSRYLASAFPEMGILETEDGNFDPNSFCHEGLCQIVPKTGVHSQYECTWDDYHEVFYQSPTQAWLEVEWQGHRLQVITISIEKEHCPSRRNYLLADTLPIAQSFFETVCRWCSEVRGEVLVYSGHWYKDSDLFEAIKGASLDNLVLHGVLKEEIRDDFLTFFESQDTYERYGIPWKRGVLFLGPPGNGKTHAIKALVNLLARPCLYVKSFKHPYQTDHDCMRSVFQRARATAPCILVLEDLDSLLDDQNRSFFLNEMDGFAANTGIITVATTNHPERLDPAILERPSRFDRKYTFHLPDTLCRASYLALCNNALEPHLRLNETEIMSIAAATEDFSFAYLKELVLSAMMQWIAHPGGAPMSSLMEAQVDNLRLQMSNGASEVPVEDPERTLMRRPHRFH